MSRSPGRLGYLGATAFCGAFLLFGVQPLLGKMVLPWFGGSPAVWTTCMLFFQVLLLGGYALAAWFERLQRRPRLLMQGLLLGAALCALPLTPAAHPPGPLAQRPVLFLLRILLVSIGLPYLVLSTTGPLAQSWFRRAAPEQSPYRLYALGNAGSLLALLSYPLAIEPWLPLRWQARLWSAGFALFALLYARSMAGDYRLHRPAPPMPPEDAPPPRLVELLRWVLLPGLGSLALLSFTNHLCQDVAVIPLLWVAPLGLYLLSFILAFAQDRRYRRGACAGATLGLLPLAVLGGGALFGAHLAFLRELGLDLLALFCLCLLCHSELHRARPHPRHLTTFYLCLSIGGALGGLGVGLIAPCLCTGLCEWRVALLAGYGLAAWVVYDAVWPLARGRSWLTVPIGSLVLAGLPVVALPLEKDPGGPVLAATRSFYGVLRVVERAAQHDRVLLHGSIQHGVQIREGALRREPASYYGEETGVGRALRYYRDVPGLRVGVIGLGVGALAAYAQPGQVFRFFEIDQEVVRLARTYFGYLQESPGQVDVALGDARLVLEQESAAPYHVLVLDAFCGDAIPAHLLTREAMDIYLRRLARDGALAVHISNRYLDLAPVVRGLAAYAGMGVARVHTPAGPGAHYPAEWLIATRDVKLLAALAPVAAGPAGPVLLWTDESSDLLRVLR